MSQLGFDFESPPEPPAPPTAADRPPASPPADPAPSPEAMARCLEQHPDYRVMRRLVPRTDHGPAPAAADGPQPCVRVLLLDTETTGLSHATDRIIELALLLVSVDPASGRAFGPVDTFEGFEDPGMPIPEVAREVTGITDDMVRGQRIDDAQVQALLDRADLVVAHNAGFDRPFVEARFPGFARTPWACSFADIDWKALGAGSARLTSLAQDQGWFYDAHRALVDCHALLQVLNGPLAGAETGLARLLAAAARPGYRLRATGSPFESKDALKARGYRWDADARVWSCLLGGDEALQAELAWLRTEVYGGRRGPVEVEALDALSRYSARGGRRETRWLDALPPPAASAPITPLQAPHTRPEGCS